MTKKKVLTSAFISMLSCRARTDSSETATVETSSFKGRVAVFDVFDKDKHLIRQAPGVLVSARAVLMPGIAADETVALADLPRKGERYIPLPAAHSSVAFIGLEAESAQAQTLAPTTVDAVPPLSSQLLKPLERGHRLKEKTDVIMYNELGYVQGYAIATADGKILMKASIEPRAYPQGGLRHLLFNYFVSNSLVKPARLSREEGEKMIRKGGALVLAAAKYDSIVLTKDGWSFFLKDSLQTATVDIVAFLGEDSEYKIKPPQPWALYTNDFVRDDIVPPAVRAAFDSVGVKMNLAPDIQREILNYVGCNKSG